MSAETTFKRELKLKLAKFCLYRERCELEVRQKLRELLAPNELCEILIQELKSEKYFSNERFAYEFARGKFALKRWGKHKIRIELANLALDETLIERALAEAIAEDEYAKTLERLISKKEPELEGINDYEKRRKLSAYLYQKGYDWEDINLALSRRLSLA